MAAVRQTKAPTRADATIVEPSMSTRTAATSEGLAEPLIVALEEDPSVRPFRANVPDDAVADLRRRLQATRWPDNETAPDQSQGPQLAKLRELVRYWGTEYDWRRGEAKLNAFPQFKTKIDGLDIHFVHVRS